VAANKIDLATAVRDAGYRYWDCITPFPVHGLDKAMGLKRSIVPRISLAGVITGFTTGMTMIWWTGQYDYPLIVGGKPLFSPLFAFLATSAFALSFASGVVGMVMAGQRRQGIWFALLLIAVNPGFALAGAYHLGQVELADCPRSIVGGAVSQVVRQRFQPDGVLGYGVMPASGAGRDDRLGGACERPARRRPARHDGGPGVPRQSWASHRSICVAWFHSEA
jgi:hypothetical protein